MKNAIIFHGTGLNPRSHWYGWLADQLIDQGWKVASPSMPSINKEPVEQTLKLLDIELDQDTVLIGHSAGVPLILSILERSNVQVAKSFLVAGFMSVIDPEFSVVLQDSYDTEKIKENCKEFYIYNSTNDPYGCDDKVKNYKVHLAES